MGVLNDGGHWERRLIQRERGGGGGKSKIVSKIRGSFLGKSEVWS